MNTLPLTIQIAIQSLGWALLHSLWQGLLVYCLLLCIYKVLPNASSRFKYNAAAIALLGTFAWFADTWLEQWQMLKGATVTITEPTTGKIITQTIHTVPASTHGAYIEHWIYNLLPWVENYFKWIVPLYLLGIFFLLLRFGYNFYSVNRLKRQTIEGIAPAWMQKLETWKIQYDINKQVKLLLTRHINVPMVIGILKPVILVPVATINHLGTDEMEAILLHELAHIKRNDYFSNIIQVFIETILFFNPFTWLISAQVRREREHCCDDFVVNHTTAPLPYAKALAALETYRQNTLAMAATGNNHFLLHRIKRIMEMKNRNISYSQLLLTVLVATGLIASLFWLTPAIAQSKKDKAPEKKTTKTVFTTTKDKIKVIDDDGTVRTYNSVKEMPQKDQEKLKGIHFGSDDEDIDISDASNKVKAIIKTIDVDKTTKEALEKIDWDGISKTIVIALKDADAQMKESDATMAIADKAMKEANKALKDIDWAEIEKANKEANKQMIIVSKQQKEAEAEMKKAMKDIDWDAIHKQMKDADLKMKDAHIQIALANERMKKIDMGDMKLLMSEDGTPGRKHKAVTVIGNGMRDTPSDIDEMLEKMDKEGVIDRSQDYTIRKKGDELYINGQVQPASIYNKYYKYMDADNVNISGSKDKLHISIANNK